MLPPACSPIAHTTRTYTPHIAAFIKVYTPYLAFVESYIVRGAPP